MARCEDCIHYFVCDALIEKGLPWNDGEYPAEAFCVAFQNKADVAPKSEVERLEAELDDLKRDTIPKLQYGLQRANAMGRDLEVELEAMRTAANSYKMHYESLAMEIFEEIEKILKAWRVELIGNEFYHRSLVDKSIAELKKKYTGEQT